MRRRRGGLTVAGLVVLAAAAGCGGPAARAGDPGAATAPAMRIVTDMRGVRVAIPATVTRVATVSDGFVESVMTRLGVVRTLVAVGSSAQQRVWAYRFPTAGGRDVSVTDGMGTMRALHPWMADLPCANQSSSDALSYETLVAARPDVVIARVGDCTIGSSPDAVTRLGHVFASTGIPLVVLRSTTDYRGTGTETLHAEIDVLGQVFDQPHEARALAAELAAVETLVRDRVATVPADRQPSVLYLGLASGARASGGAAYAWGLDTAESWMIERIVGARNAFRGPGARVLLNAEQILALDPDVIFLPTSAGFHPQEELAQAPYFAELRGLRAVRSGRVHALAWSPMNCARRLEYPLDLLIMAKGAHPDRFADVRIHEWSLHFYRRLYSVDHGQAMALRRAQWLEWTVTAAF